jgi:hypothetical protein
MVYIHTAPRSDIPVGDATLLVAVLLLRKQVRETACCCCFISLCAGGVGAHASSRAIDSGANPAVDTDARCGGACAGGGDPASRIPRALGTRG